MSFNHFLKKALPAAALAALLAALLVCGVFADIIYVPDGNSFYLAHSKECEYLGRHYIVADPSGKISAYDSPGGGAGKATYPNGTQFWITHAYTDGSGAVWGISAEGHLSDSGWVLLSGLELVYDYISFAEEHGAEFADYDPQKHPLPKSGEVKFWKYPDSGVVISKADSPELNITKVYTAPDGRIWGFVTYYQTVKNFWVCLDNLGSEPETSLETTVLEPAIPVEPEEDRDGAWLIPVIAAALLAAGAGIMISIFYERKKV